MNKILIGIAAAVALIGTPALAADMPLKAPPPPPAVFSWTGFMAASTLDTVGATQAMTGIFLPQTLVRRSVHPQAPRFA